MYQCVRFMRLLPGSGRRLAERLVMASTASLKIPLIVTLCVLLVLNASGSQAQQAGQSATETATTAPVSMAAMAFVGAYGQPSNNQVYEMLTNGTQAAQVTDTSYAASWLTWSWDATQPLINFDYNGPAVIAVPGAIAGDADAAFADSGRGPLRRVFA
jgi:hypothetical protein